MIDIDGLEKDYPLEFSSVYEGSEQLADIDQDYFNRYISKVSYLNFGGILKALRNDINITSEELSDISQLSRPYISQIENNYRLPSNKAIKKLATGLAKLLINDLNMRGLDAWDVDFGRQLVYFYERLLLSAKTESERLNSIDKKIITDGVNITGQESKLLNAFRSIDNEAQKVVMNLVDYLVKDETDESDKETD
ncbi:MAG: helix-turn-helix domain-containing protein [Aerococcus sp.]|nr:helix-turn-helix domain-containing protein [Aerococcus sp.]